ncbi:hypothetical protein [Microcoleus sp. Pol12B4]|uniref:hypothetical protein n=1 Tax=Microcoleus sp. Pol12B4 TaxID=3055395 RepID=UPI002FD3F98B
MPNWSRIPKLGYWYDKITNKPPKEKLKNQVRRTFFSAEMCLKWFGTFDMMQDILKEYEIELPSWEKVNRIVDRLSDVQVQSLLVAIDLVSAFSPLGPI